MDFNFVVTCRYLLNQDLRKDTNCSVNIGSGLSKIHHIRKQSSFECIPTTLWRVTFWVIVFWAQVSEAVVNFPEILKLVWVSFELWNFISVALWYESLAVFQKRDSLNNNQVKFLSSWRQSSFSHFSDRNCLKNMKYIAWKIKVLN